MVYFVSGPSCAGKSTYIKQYFPDAIVIDLYDYQKRKANTYQNVAESYEICKQKVLEAIKKYPDKDIIMEHTLLKSKRRKPYIDAIKEQFPDAQINMIFLNPSKEQLLRNAKARNISLSEDEIDYINSIMDIPTTDEGFETVNIVESFDFDSEK